MGGGSLMTPLLIIVAGNVDWVLMLNILLGSIPGVWLGSHLVTKIEVSTLRLALAIVLLGGGLGLLSKAGANIPPAVIAAGRGLVAVVIFLGGKGGANPGGP